MANLQSILGKAFVTLCVPSAFLDLILTSIWLVLDLGVTQTPREVLLGPVILCRQLDPHPASALGCPLGEVSICSFQRALKSTMSRALS